MSVITTLNDWISGNSFRTQVNTNFSNLNTDKAETSALTSGLAGKQDTLVSWTNIKTINSTSILGSGDIVISGGGSVATDAIWDAKWDLAGGTGANTASRLAVGTNGQVLTADSAEVTGLKWSNPAGGWDALTSWTLAQFASTTSLQLKWVISDETGSGSLVFATSPTLVTPSLGVASATSINGATITSGTLNGSVTGTNTGDNSANTTSDAYALTTPDFYKYSITTSASGGNLTVALKNYEGNDPTASKPVKIQIGGVIRTITSACYINATIAWTNWWNAWSTELATKEIDWFVYILDYNNSGAVFNLWISRYPLYNNLSEATWWYTSEKYLIQSWNIWIENVVNIGRFNATLSAGAGYTWSIPATSVIINRPILENQKQKNQLIVGEWINQSASYTTSVTMDFSSFIEYDITAQAWALLFNNPSGTPVNWQKRMVRIKDNWTARALTYWTQFASWSGTLLPTTVISKKSWMGFEWDSTDSKYYCIASCTQP